MTDSRLLIIGLLFVVHFGFGYWLTRTGRPYNTIAITVHKLAAVAALVLIGLSVWRAWQGAGLGLTMALTVIALVIVFVVAIASGGMLSAADASHKLVINIHKYTPYLVLLLAVMALYLMRATVAG